MQDALHFSSDVRTGDDPDGGSGIWDIELTFSALLSCNTCKDVISCCGDGWYDPEETYDEQGHVRDYEPVEYFRPHYFSQALHILPLDRRWPKPIRERLKLSFRVFFCDMGAAANHVRACVEELLTERDVPSVTRKGARIPLHKRIQLFKTKDSENAERAEALKWIGNVGSHEVTLDRDDLFDAYDIMDTLLEDIYIGHYRSVKKKVEEINRAKGVRKA